MYLNHCDNRTEVEYHEYNEESEYDRTQYLVDGEGDPDAQEANEAVEGFYESANVPDDCTYCFDNNTLLG